MKGLPQASNTSFWLAVGGRILSAVNWTRNRHEKQVNIGRCIRVKQHVKDQHDSVQGFFFKQPGILSGVKPLPTPFSHIEIAAAQEREWERTDLHTAGIVVHHTASLYLISGLKSTCYLYSACCRMNIYPVHARIRPVYRFLPPVKFR